MYNLEQSQFYYFIYKAKKFHTNCFIKEDKNYINLFLAFNCDDIDFILDDFNFLEECEKYFTSNYNQKNWKYFYEEYKVEENTFKIKVLGIKENILKDYLKNKKEEAIVSNVDRNWNLAKNIYKVEKKEKYEKEINRKIVGCVYILEVGGMVKIGKTINIKERMKALKAMFLNYSPWDTGRVLYSNPIKNNSEVENFLHKKFNVYRKNPKSELFLINLENIIRILNKSNIDIPFDFNYLPDEIEEIIFKEEDPFNNIGRLLDGISEEEFFKIAPKIDYFFKNKPVLFKRMKSDIKYYKYVKVYEKWQSYKKIQRKIIKDKNEIFFSSIKNRDEIDIKYFCKKYELNYQDIIQSLLKANLLQINWSDDGFYITPNHNNKDSRIFFYKRALENANYQIVFKKKYISYTKKLLKEQKLKEEVLEDG